MTGLLALALAAQLPGQVHPESRPLPGSVYEKYGVPFTASVEDLVLRGGAFVRPLRNFRVQGTVEPFVDGLYLLAHRSYRVVLIPAYGFDGLRVMRGRSVELVGIARELQDRYEVYTCNATTSEGVAVCTDCQEPVCEEPDLPPLPTLSRGGPRLSITVWSISELSAFERRRGLEGATELSQIVGAPEEWVGRRATVVGQFCGRGLCGPRPAGSPRKPEDWAIAQGGVAVWISGKPPKGKGWQLDPAYAGDSKWWVRVTGEVELVGGGISIRARELELTPAPDGP